MRSRDYKFEKSILSFIFKPHQTLLVFYIVNVHSNLRTYLPLNLLLTFFPASDLLSGLKSRVSFSENQLVENSLFCLLFTLFLSSESITVIPEMYFY